MSQAKSHDRRRGLTRTSLVKFSFLCRHWATDFCFLISNRSVGACGCDKDDWSVCLVKVGLVMLHSYHYHNDNVASDSGVGKHKSASYFGKGTFGLSQLRTAPLQSSLVCVCVCVHCKLLCWQCSLSVSLSLCHLIFRLAQLN